MTIVLPDKRLSIPSVLTVTSPLIHSDERVEVMQRFRREPIIGPDGEILDVPIYSGNAIRGMLRRAAALRVCEEIGVGDRELPARSFYLLFSGGYLDSSDYAVRIEEIAEVRRLLPILLLFGASWGSRVLSGHLEVWRGEPIARELAHLPGHEDHEAEHSVFELLTEVSYARRDDIDDRGEESDGPTVQMRYSFEALIPGTRLLHGCVVTTTDELALGCLADAVVTCTDQSSLGGRSAIGHGRFTWTWQQDLAERYAEQAEAYREHLRSNREAIREALEVSG